MKVECFVSVIAPLHNDGDIVEPFVADVLGVLRNKYTNYELVFVDDGSEHETVDHVTPLLTRYECIRLIRLSRPFGEEVAVAAGLDAVIGDFVVVMLPNSDPPELIPEFVERSRHGVDIVFGVRKSLAGEPWLRRAAAALFDWYCHKVLKLDLPRNAALFRCMSRQAVNAVGTIKDSYRYLRLFTADIGYPKEGVAYEPINRRGSTRRQSLGRAVGQGIEIIIETSAHPLRFVSWLGLAASTVNLLYALYVVGIYLFKRDVAPGWPTLSLQNAGQFFLISLILTVLSEYMGRLLNRLRERPLYHAYEERTSAVPLADGNRRNVLKLAPVTGDRRSSAADDRV